MIGNEALSWTFPPVLLRRTPVSGPQEGSSSNSDACRIIAAFSASPSAS